MAGLRLFAALGAAFALISVGAGAATPPVPDPSTQPLKDGCQRSPGPLLLLAITGIDATPEWAYVYRDKTVRVAEGLAHSSSPAGGDLPGGHAWYDFNSNVELDVPYRYLLAGSPAKKNGNFGGSGEETGRLHVEWETGDRAGHGTLPPFAWISEGDRVKVWGSWTWDCGHWGQNFQDPDYFLPGTGETPFSTDVPGEGTEFHPMRAMVVTRANPYRPRRTETETDVFISSDGTGAHAEEECARLFAPVNKASYGADYISCTGDPARKRQAVNDRDYRFLVPAPPRPSRRAKLRWRVVDMVHGDGPSERVKLRRDGISVTIPFRGYGGDTRKLVYGKSFFVRWSGADSHPPEHLRITFKTLKVIHSLDPAFAGHPTQLSLPPGEYGLYVDVNGYWRYLNDWAPGLDAVSDGQTFRLARSVDLYVQRGRGVRLYTHGRECDIPQILPCPRIAEGADDNDLPGDGLARFASTAAAIGDHVLRPPSGNYELSYSVERVG